MISPLVTALRTLSILPVPGSDTGDFKRSLPFFPIAGAVLASCIVAVAAGADYLFQGIPLVQGALPCLFLVILTGGIHIDGLADSADGVLGGKDRESMLRIMKDSRVGVFGATALVFGILFRTLAYDTALTRGLIELIALSLILSRTIQALVLASVPYARKNKGTGAPFGNARGYIPLLSIELAVAAAAGGFVAGWWILIPLGIAVGVIVLLSYYFYRTIGGITGDSIGCLSEIFEIVFLLCAVTPSLQGKLPVQ